MNDQTNPLLCDFETRACGMPSQDKTTTGTVQVPSQKPLKLIYFTDPICSSCWGIEPQLRKLKLEYGALIDIEYRMGGLLPDWSYNSGGISGPKDVAVHWDEASHYYQMPIDGDVWLEDPLSSSYPPSIAFKAAQMQDEQKAIRFLRLMREALFLQKQNIEKWAVLESAAKEAGLDAAQLKKDYEGLAKALFEQDLALSRKMGVRGFPTLFVRDSAGQQELIYGARPYEVYENALLKMDAKAEKKSYPKDWQSLFAQFKSLALREFAELSAVDRQTAKKTLEALTKDGKLRQLNTKNGAVWFLN